MANWFDFVSLILTIAFFGGAIYAVVLAVNSVSKTVQSTKETLKEKGLHISDKGVSLKTTSRFNREDYIDATQRGLMKSMAASSFGTADNIEKTPVMSRQNSMASNASGSGSGVEKEEKKKSRFGLGRKHSK